MDTVKRTARRQRTARRSEPPAARWGLGAGLALGPTGPQRSRPARRATVSIVN